jgi:hypothetical protein
LCVRMMVAVLDSARVANGATMLYSELVVTYWSRCQKAADEV